MWAVVAVRIFDLYLFYYNFKYCSKHTKMKIYALAMDVQCCMFALSFLCVCVKKKDPCNKK